MFEHHREKLYFIYPENMKIYRSIIKNKYATYSQVSQSPFNFIMAFIYTYRSCDFSRINIKKFLSEYKNSISRGYGYRHSNIFPSVLESYIFRAKFNYPVPLLIVNKHVEPLQKLLNIFYEIFYIYRIEFEALGGYNRTVFHRIRNLMKIDAGHDVSEGGILTSLCEMAFAGDCGLDITIDPNLLFYEGLGILFQCRELVVQIMGPQLKSCGAFTIAKPNFNLKRIRINDTIDMSLSELRKCWYMTSHDMECIQMNKDVANERLKNINKPMKQFNISEELSKRLECLNFHRQNIKAAIIRDKGTNGDREMAYALYHVGFDVKDVTMTDIVENRENLEDVNFIVFCGGFSNSDVLGSARGWASIFKYNKVARKVLENYYSREDTLSLSVCNGNQLAILLNLIDPENIFEEPNIVMKENKSGIFESRFISVDIKKSSSIFLRGLEGSTLGIWVAHKEGRFYIKDKSKFSLEQIPMVYSNSEYPFNPNGSDYDIAAVCSKDGRHLSLMPHMERSIFPWQCGYYPYFHYGMYTNEYHKMIPWIIFFENALIWIKDNK